MNGLHWLDFARPAPPPGPCSGGAADPCAPLLLRDGRRVSVQALRAGDAAAEQDFVRSLSRQSRYRRFHVGIPELPASLLSQLVDVDQLRHVALAAREASGVDSGAIVADARYVRLDAEQAEFALTVADDWQGQGLGAELLRRLARHAQARRLHWLRGDVLHDNRPMLALVERLGGSLRSRRGEAGVLVAELSVELLAA